MTNDVPARIACAFTVHYEQVHDLDQIGGHTAMNRRQESPDHDGVDAIHPVLDDDDAHHAMQRWLDAMYLAEAPIENAGRRGHHA